jgi:hypothetical protein
MFAPFGRGYSSTPNPSSGAKYGLVDAILSFLERMNVGCASKYYTSSSPSGGRYSDPLSPQWVGKSATDRWVERFLDRQSKQGSSRLAWEEALWQ